MGFMSQFNQQQAATPQQPNGQLANLIMQARQLAEESGGSRAAIQKLMDSGAMCTMPSGKQISVKDIVDMSQGKTVSQLVSQLLQA